MGVVEGNYVTRISYGHDLLFRVANLKREQAVLHGVDIRLSADAPLDDLVQVEDRELNKREQKVKKQEDVSYRLFIQDYRMLKEKREYESTDGYTHEDSRFQLPVKVLHLDGDQNYLRKCMELYEKIGLQVYGVHLHEKDMAQEISALLKNTRPDIVVFTGHDAYSKRKGMKSELRAYRNSKYFVDTVREARQVTPQLDDLIIFAGGCQSHFESLIRAGANFASSPSRVNIHALDPVYIVGRIAYTSFMEKVNVRAALRNTFTGDRGMGGIETKGLLRLGMPYMEEDSGDS
ncbi:sporulation peptidase YabG [Virgibacillus sp. W0181]|uniref:sporulation peptidase YabG n=1 Tax=Virgibacillus sp. W0181 TaxID=3391581 RepID=UPI003F451725